MALSLLSLHASCCESGEGEDRGGQGPLLLTCHCKVNKLSHSVVAVIVAIVVVDAVV